ncbi:MAG: hypothetical protein GYB67_13310, partial [Chloroflexi bacterium]|nr:hypothetical protein [Chloroflexota bacterium]
MINRKTFEYGFYAAVIAVILALTGLFSIFEQRFVIDDRLTLSAVALVLMLGTAAYFTGSQVKNGDRVALTINTVVGSVIVGGALALLIVIEATIDLTFVFPNTINPVGEALSFGAEYPGSLIALLVFSAGVGAVMSGLLIIPARARQMILASAGLTIVIGLLRNQIDSLITLSDALALAAAFGLGFGVAVRRGADLPTGQRLLLAALPGVGLGAVLGVIASGGGVAEGGILRIGENAPLILGTGADAGLIAAALSLAVILGAVGAVGGLLMRSTRTFHDGMLYLVASLLIFGVLNWQ